MSPSHAQRCRALLAEARTAALSTLAREPAGFPFGSLVTLAVDPRGRPLLLLSDLAEHTGNLRACADVSVLVLAADAAEPLAAERVTLLGRCARVPDEEAPAALATFLAQQPSAEAYARFADFALYRVEPVALRYVGGFGRMSWVGAEDYGRAAP